MKDGILMEVFKPEHLEASSKNDGLLLCFFGFEFLGIFSYLSILLMEEIRLTSQSVVYSIIGF